MSWASFLVCFFWPNSFIRRLLSWLAFPFSCLRLSFSSWVLFTKFPVFFFVLLIYKILLGINFGHSFDQYQDDCDDLCIVTLLRPTEIRGNSPQWWDAVPVSKLFIASYISTYIAIPPAYPGADFSWARRLKFSASGPDSGISRGRGALRFPQI